MIYLNAVLLAIVEGVTEFLPISSTGHLILAEKLFPVGDGTSSFPEAFSVLIQLPAIAAVALYFWRTLWPFGQGDEHRAKTIALWFNVLAAFVPAVVLGLLFGDFVHEHLFNPITVAAALFVGGILLLVLERVKHTTRYETVHSITFAGAVGIGIIQCLALIPGTSRSAATIIGAMVLGASRSAAAEFSFFLAVPTMCGASTYEIAKHGVDFTAQQWALVALGSVVSFATAYAAVAFLMRYIQRHDFSAFGIYRIVLAGIVLLAYLV